MDFAQSDSKGKGNNALFQCSIIHEILSNGQIINGISLHGPTGLYTVSTFNEETEENWIQVWRRKT